MRSSVPDLPKPVHPDNALDKKLISCRLSPFPVLIFMKTLCVLCPDTRSLSRVLSGLIRSMFGSNSLTPSNTHPTSADSQNDNTRSGSSSLNGQPTFLDCAPVGLARYPFFRRATNPSQRAFIHLVRFYFLPHYLPLARFFTTRCAFRTFFFPIRTQHLSLLLGPRVVREGIVSVPPHSNKTPFG